MSYEQYKIQINRVRRVVCATQVNADERWGRKLIVNFQNKLSSGRR